MLVTLVSKGSHENSHHISIHAAFELSLQWRGSDGTDEYLDLVVHEYD
jgi:hypothetical protein